MEENQIQKPSFASRSLSIKSAGAAILAILLTFIFLYAVLNRNGFDSSLYKIGILSCSDSDKNTKEEGIYVSSTVKGWEASHSRIMDVPDKCHGSLILESTCDTTGTVTSNSSKRCPYGCNDGRCLEKEESFQQIQETTLDVPYEITWNQESNGDQYSGNQKTKARFQLTGVVFGKKKISDGFENTPGYTLKTGEDVPVMILRTKVTALTIACLNPLVRNLEPETGSLKSPLVEVNNSYPYNQCSNQINTTSDREIVFPVSESANEFYILTGDDYNPFIKISISGDAVQVEPMTDVSSLPGIPDETKREIFPFKALLVKPEKERITLKRGEALNLEWKVGGFAKDETIVFSLRSLQCGMYGGSSDCMNEEFSYDATQLSASIPITVPVGEYHFIQVSPQSSSGIYVTVSR